MFSKIHKPIVEVVTKPHPWWQQHLWECRRDSGLVQHFETWGMYASHNIECPLAQQAHQSYSNFALLTDLIKAGGVMSG